MIEPGPVVTSFFANAKSFREDIDISSADDKTKSLLKETLQSYYESFTNFNQPASDIAEAVKKALLLKNPNFRYQTNTKAYRQKESASKISDPTGNAIMELFSKSFASAKQELVKVKENMKKEKKKKLYNILGQNYRM